MPKPHGVRSHSQRNTAQQRPADSPAPPEAAAPPPARFPIVGLGASAGGLAAFEAFFSAMPTDPAPGLAVVLVQHLAPDHKSLLSDLITRYTQMRVFDIADGMLIQPNCAYIIPPNRELTLSDGALHLHKPTVPHSQIRPIDSFFQSLAADQRERAIGVVLSGAGSDGALGVQAIKRAGGRVIAQTPDSAAYDSMPRSAIATGLVDAILPPAAMPAQLIAFMEPAAHDAARSPSSQTRTIAEMLAPICAILHDQTGHDFGQYKANTLVRRIERRMSLRQIVRADAYLAYLQGQPAEVTSLFRDLLIGVTSFFRDPEAFSVLTSQVIPRLVAGVGSSMPVRVWVCGCSTGEEAYTLAMLFQEHVEALGQPVKIQIFATDLDALAIEQARAGSYPDSIAADVAPERLARFFTHDAEGGRYLVRKSLRDLLVFSAQDVIADPPFSRLDLVSCRNVLIYLSAELQKRVIPLFHYALKPAGVLFLGTSETIGDFASLFAPLDRTWKIYQRHVGAPGAARPALGRLSRRPADAVKPPGWAGAPARVEPRDLRALAEQALLEHVAAAAALVTAQGEILHIIGRTGSFLEPAQGDANMNILAMARDGLRRELTIALHKAAAQRAPVRYPGLRAAGASTHVDLTVRPATPGAGGDAPADLFLVVFEEAPPGAPAALSVPSAPAAAADQRIAALEQELRANQDYLQAALEQMAQTNDALQSANEELQSTNEELQSTNEELETSQEELQSVNEELATVNEELRTVNTELQHKVADLVRANNDMNNLLAGTGIGTLFVDFQLQIARFTPSITQIINLIPTDVGRPVGDIASTLVGYDRLAADVQAVLDTLIPQESEVQTRGGAWYLMRIRPYRTLENVIEGAVISFIDITQRKQIEMALSSSEAKFAKAFHASHDGLAISRRADGALLDVNASWEALAGYRRPEALGRTMLDLRLFAAPAEWQRALDQLEAYGAVRDTNIELRDRAGGQRWALVSVEPLDSEPEPCLLTTLHDITERRLDGSESGT